MEMQNPLPSASSKELQGRMEPWALPAQVQPQPGAHLSTVVTLMGRGKVPSTKWSFLGSAFLLIINSSAAERKLHPKNTHRGLCVQEPFSLLKTAATRDKLYLNRAAKPCFLQERPLCKNKGMHLPWDAPSLGCSTFTAPGEFFR